MFSAPKRRRAAPENNAAGNELSLRREAFVEQSGK
jgi:hypothetical protein